MKKSVLAKTANSVAALSRFVALIGIGTASSFGMHQPKVPQSLIK